MTEVWGRYVELQIGSEVFTNSDFDISFSIENTTGSEAGSAEISIYNLADTTKVKIVKDTVIQLKAGYESSGYGIIFVGKIDKTHDKIEGADVETVIEALDAMKDLLKGESTRKFSAKGTSVSTIIEELFTEAGIAIGTIEDCGVVLDNIFMEVGTPYAIAERYTQYVNGELKKATGKEGTWRIYVRNNTGFFVEGATKLTVEAVVLSSETGLMEAVEDKDEEAGIELRVKTLLQWKIAVDSIVALKSKYATGTYKVIEYKHIGNDNSYYTEAGLGAI